MWSMREEIRSLRCSWVKFWVSWHDLTQGLNRAPISFDEQAQMMDYSYGWTTSPLYPNGSPLYPDGVAQEDLYQPLIRYLDQSIRLANTTPRWDYPIDDPNAPKTGVILCVQQDAPTWSWWSGAPATAPTEDYSGKGPRHHFPNDLAADSPYGWFIQYLVARYSGGVQSPEPGLSAQPANVAKRGNPDGAFIHALEPLNEPNYAWWPQTSAVCNAAMAMTTCEYWCRFYSQTYATYPIWTLGPSSSDNDITKHFPDGSGSYHLGCELFTGDVAFQLREWNPQAPVRWAHHNYRDIEEDEPVRDYDSSNLKKVKNKLDEQRFLANSTAPVNAGEPRDIWLTEGAYRMGGPDPFGYYSLAPENDFSPGSLKYEAQEKQRDQIANNYEQMRAHSTAVLWTQHAVNDSHAPYVGYLGDNPTYALREPWRGGIGPNRKRLAWDKLSKFNPDGPDFP
jgi:hypothetical protein